MLDIYLKIVKILRLFYHPPMICFDLTDRFPIPSIDFVYSLYYTWRYASFNICRVTEGEATYKEKHVRKPGKNKQLEYYKFHFKNPIRFQICFLVNIKNPLYHISHAWIPFIKYNILMQMYDDKKWFFIV